MSAPLASEEETRYTQIIDGILATADLNTVTRKKIRLGLEKALGGQNLSEQKDAIKKLIEARFDAISAVKDSPPPEMPPSSMPIKNEGSPHKRPLNGHHDDEADEATSDAGDDGNSNSYQPVKKKIKRDPSTEDTDAKLAAKLQAQENLRSTARTTRGGGGPAKPAKKKKKAPRKKSEKKVGAEDDSEVEASEETAPKRKAGGGFQKPFNLSFPLADLCGEPRLPRTTVVKKLWQHIKGHDLQDPKDKRQICCDEKMFAIFKQAKIDMFQMNKAIGNHLYPVEDE